MRRRHYYGLAVSTLEASPSLEAHASPTKVVQVQPCRLALREHGRKHASAKSTPVLSSKRSGGFSDRPTPPAPGEARPALMQRQ